MDRELIEYLDRFRGELREELRQGLISLREALRTEIASGQAETRRHFDVVAEGLMGRIQLVGEGVIGVDQKVDRLATEMQAEFQRVDRRFLHLEARVHGLRG